MVICETCYQSYPDDTAPEKCEVCGAELNKPVLTEAAVVNVTRPQEEAPVRRESPPIRLPRRVVPEQEKRPVEEPDKAPGPGPSQSTTAAPARTPLYRKVEPVVKEEDDDLDPQYLETISAFDKNEAIVTVIGYGGSGKTFFVNRLRHDLAGSWKRKPGAKEEIPISPGGIELTRFTPRGGGPSYLVLDCAGESFATAFRTQGSIEELTQTVARPYLAALALARAFVLVIKAEHLLTYSQPDRNDEPIKLREERKFIRTMLTEFDDIIHAIVITKSRLLGGETPESILRKGISKEELKQEYKQARRCSQPLYVAFSLADRLAALRGDTYDIDPFLFALETAPVLFKTINESFDHYRFDFLSAFHGHGSWDEDEDADVLDPEEEKRRNLRPDYRRPSYGAMEAFEWIHGKRSLQGELPTREVVELRRKTDPAFRAAWRGR